MTDNAPKTEITSMRPTVEELEDGLRITPDQLHGTEIDTYDDHRMAMSMALVGLLTPGVFILIMSSRQYQRSESSFGCWSRSMWLP